MSQNGSEASEPGPDEPKNDSVYDFLYHDARRVGSFLSQFDEAGHLQQITESEGAQRGSRRGWKAAAGGSIPLVGGANVSLELGPEKGGFVAAERVYDPLWGNARSLLDFLTERNLVSRHLLTARIGQFVLVSGELSILQITLLKDFWTGPNFKEKTIETQIANAMAKMLGSPAMSDAAGTKVNREKTALAKQTRANALLGLDLISSLPHVVQATLTGKDTSVWCVLSENCLIPTPSEITLKYGSLVMPGEWHALGILDAMPSLIPPVVEIPFSEIPRHIGPVVGNFANVARTMLGRPAESFGITPLMIFREVATG